MSTCSDLMYLLEDFGEFEFDEEEYIRSCFDDKAEDQPDKLRKDSVAKRNINAEKSVRKPIVYTKQIIPPGDVRRTYPKAFESAWNNYDRSQLHDLFHGFGTKDLLTIVAYPHGNPHGPSYREIHGAQATTEYYYAYLCSVPDSLFFIHETKFIIKQGGNISIVCKFTLTGSRLYLINMTGDSEGSNAPADTSPSSPRGHMFEGHKATLSSVSQDSCDSSHIRSLSAMNVDSQQPPALDLDEHLDAYNAFKQHIVFKDAYSVKNKHDKYRRMNHSTMGEYIDYSRLNQEEGSIEADGKQYAAEVKPHVQAIKTEGTVPNKKRAHSNDPPSANPSVSCVNTSGAAPSKDTLKRLYSGRASAADSVTSSDILVSRSNARFGLSTILPSAVRSNMCGVLRFHVDADKKVYKLELMCAFERGEDNA